MQLERIATVNEIGATAQYVDDPDGLIQKLFDNRPEGTAVIIIDSLDLLPDGAVVDETPNACQSVGNASGDSGLVRSSVAAGGSCTPRTPVIGVGTVG